jgi:hypothetical protein
LFTKASIETYFLAEKNAQLICMLLSVAALLFAALFFFYYKTEKTKRAAIFLLLMGVFFSIIGFIGYQQNDSLRFEQLYAFDMDPSSLKSQAVPRLQQYIRFITNLHMLGFVLGLLGLGGYLFTSFKKTAAVWQGAALATFVMACIMAGMSYLSYDRTHHYLEALQTFTAAF